MVRQKSLGGGLLALIVAALVMSGCLGGAQPEPPTTNWEHDASVPTDLGLPPPPLDAGVRDASAVDAAAPAADGGTHPSTPENLGDAFDGDDNAFGAATTINSRPGWSLPDVTIDASVIALPDGGVDATSP